MSARRALSVLAVDDERPALEDLARLLRGHAQVERGACSRTAAARRCGCWPSGSSTRLPRRAHAGPRRARARGRPRPLRRTRRRSCSCRAYEDGAVRRLRADLHALDYLMKPVSRAADRAGARAGRRGDRGAPRLAGGRWPPPTRASRAWTADARRRDHPRRAPARRRHPARPAARRSSTSRPRATTCAWSPTAAASCMRDALSEIERRWRRTASCACTAATSSNLRRAVEIRPELGGRRHDRARRRQRGPGRAPAGRRPAPAAADVRCRVGAAEPPAGAVRCSPRDELADATAHGHVYLRRLRHAQLKLSIAGAGRVRRGVRRAAARALPAAAAAPHHLLGVPVAARGSWSCRCCRCSSRSAGCTPAAPTRSTRTSATCVETALIALLAVGARDARDARARHLGHALGADDLRSARRLARGHAMVERGRDLRRVPVGGELPRDRRPRDADRRERAVAVARLHRRLSRAAAVRRGAAAPVRLLHDPRLRRGAAAQPAAAPAGRGDRAGDRRLLPGAPAEGRRAGAERRHRRRRTGSGCSSSG